MRIYGIYGWEPLVFCHYDDKFCGHKHCDGGDMFSACHVTSLEHILNKLFEFMGGSPSR